MPHGSIDAFFHSGRTPSEVMDLVPVKPLEPEESHVRQADRSRLGALYANLTDREREPALR